MYEIVYSFIPKTYWSCAEDEKRIHRITTNEWVGITIMDSNPIYKHKGWKERMSANFFVDDMDEVTKLLWHLRENTEELSLNKIINKNKNTSVLIESENILKQNLIVTDIRKDEVFFLYTLHGKTNKIVYITPGETMDIYIKNNSIDFVEWVISKQAEKVDYYQYVLGE